MSYLYSICYKNSKGEYQIPNTADGSQRKEANQDMNSAKNCLAQLDVYIIKKLTDNGVNMTTIN